MFTWPGGLYRVDPTGPDGTWVKTRLGDIAGRVRDAVVLPGDAHEVATVSRNGTLSILRLTPEGPLWTTVYEAPMGMGRIALRPGSTPANTVLYTTHDDGRILRHARPASGRWVTETIYLGPQGPRGIAAGRFYADPKVESVAIVVARDGHSLARPLEPLGPEAPELLRNCAIPSRQETWSPGSRDSHVRSLTDRTSQLLS